MNNIVAFSNDLNLCITWEKKLSHYSIKILFSIEELFNYKNCIALLDGNSCYKEIVQIMHQAHQLNIKVLLMDIFPSFKKGKEFLKLNIFGYGDASMNSIYLNSAIHTIQNGLIWLYPEFITTLLQEMPKENNVPTYIQNNLSKRELEIAVLIKNGHSNNEISTLLSISHNTVKSHSVKIYEKLSIKNRLSLALLFHQ